MWKFSIVVVFIFSLLFIKTECAFSETTQRLDARVLRTDSAKQLLTVRFIHPVTGEHIAKEFTVTGSTGFKRVKNLTKIKEGDLVTIDYRE